MSKIVYLAPEQMDQLIDGSLASEFSSSLPWSKGNVIARGEHIKQAEKRMEELYSEDNPDDFGVLPHEEDPKELNFA